MIRKKEKGLKWKFYNNFRWDSLKFLYIIIIFRCINGQMEVNMLEIGKTVSDKEKELKWKIYNNFRWDSLNSFIYYYYFLGIEIGKWRLIWWRLEKR